MNKKSIHQRLEDLWADYSSYVRYLEKKIYELEKELEIYRPKKEIKEEELLPNPDDYLERKYNIFSSFFKVK